MRCALALTFFDPLELPNFHVLPTFTRL
jgi:hypothetical protein